MNGHESSPDTRGFTSRDEADLNWFFSFGQSCFERSTFGAMIDAAKHFGHTQDGNRVDTMRQVEARVWRYRQGLCSGSSQLVDVAEDPSLDAQVTQQKRGGEPGYEPNDYALRRYAIVSRRLSKLTQQAYLALMGFYGLQAGRWETHPLGKLVCVVVLTSAGRRLLDNRRRRLPDDEGRPEQCFAGEYELEQQKRDDIRRALLGKAERQALQLVSDAQAAYGGTQA